jgi:hypothetical protein
MASKGEAIACDKDPVDRATTSVLRAIEGLVELLGDDDPERSTRALAALYDIGKFTAAPLAARLARTRTTSAAHRAEIMKALMMISPRARPEVLVAMTKAMQSEPDPGLREFAARAHDPGLRPPHGADGRGD